MGTVGTYMTPAKLTASEMGIGTGHTELIHKATGATFDGRTSTWMILRMTNPERSDFGRVLVVEAITSYSSRTGYATCKIVDEDMGPDSTQVPPSIVQRFHLLSPVEPGSYAAAFREGAVRSLAAWPLSLAEVPDGATVEVQGYPGAWTRVGTYKGTPVFSNDTHRRARFPRSNKQRARLATTEETTHA